jgi:hypothetical protein
LRDAISFWLFSSLALTLAQSLMAELIFDSGDGERELMRPEGGEGVE